MPDDFTLSNARRFYSVQRQTILLCPTPDDFTLSDTRRFYSVQRQTILLCPTPDNFTLSNPRQFYSVQRQTILLRPMPDDFTRQRVKVDFFGRTLRHSESFKNGVFGAGAIFRLFLFFSSGECTE